MLLQQKINAVIGKMAPTGDYTIGEIKDVVAKDEKITVTTSKDSKIITGTLIITVK